MTKQPFSIPLCKTTMHKIQISNSLQHSNQLFLQIEIDSFLQSIYHHFLQTQTTHLYRKKNLIPYLITCYSFITTIKHLLISTCHSPTVILCFFGTCFKTFFLKPNYTTPSPCSEFLQNTGQEKLK